jgi:hypothetical protein
VPIGRKASAPPVILKIRALKNPPDVLPGGRPSFKRQNKQSKECFFAVLLRKSLTQQLLKRTSPVDST